jgi:hypothetical protein
MADELEDGALNPSFIWRWNHALGKWDRWYLAPADGDDQVISMTTETRDGSGAGDHDVPFVWGHPFCLLSTMAHAHLLSVRGKLLEQRFQAGIGAAKDPDALDRYEAVSPPPSPPFRHLYEPRQVPLPTEPDNDLEPD